MSEWSNIFNPFNSAKLFAHIDRWRERGYPVTVTVDPSNKCNLKCSWCNSTSVTGSGKMLGDEDFNDILYTLNRWGTRAVCIAGGGEPMLNKGVGDFIESLCSLDIQSGVVTNGTIFNDSLQHCSWVGASVDSASSETYKKIKGVDLFDKTCDNISKLSSIEDCNLSEQGRGRGVFLKYLLCPDNIHDVYDACVLAKTLGCRGIHIRPVGTPWDSTDKIEFTKSMIETFKVHVEHARALEDEEFSVYSVTHKFAENLQKNNDFKKCNAVYMNCVFSPEGVGLCCDRRGDSRLMLCDSFIDIPWGGSKHDEIFNAIDPIMCPRCTYAPHNRIYENAIEVDNMTIDFI